MQHAAWAVALERYKDAYGEAFDPCESDNVSGFLDLVEQETRARLEAEMGEYFREATERLRAIGTANHGG